LRQVFANLVGNAIDACDRSCLLTLRVREALDWGTGMKGIRLLVADTGHGMSAATSRRIFEPFFTTKNLTGTGLRLWASSEILFNHKAKVSVRTIHL